jgi:hypothetical protein
VNLREDAVVAAINRWIGQLFSRDNVDQTVEALVGSQRGPSVAAGSDAAKARLTKAEGAVRRLQDAIPGRGRPECRKYAMIDALGDVGGALKRAQPDSLVKEQ